MTTRRSMLGLLGAAPLAASAVLATEGPAHADPPRFGRIPEGLQPGGELDQFVAAQADKDEFSGTLLLTYRSRPILSRSYGMANKQLEVPVEPGTIFTLASVTKLFTAVAIAQLAQQGKVSFSGTLGTYLSGFPTEIATKVTVHHLLTHSSGFGDHHLTPGFWEKAATWTSAEQVMEGINAFIRQSALAFTPGAAMQYSNSGYHLLGAIVAQVSGQSYYDYVREHIFARAGMRSSGFYTRTQWRDDRRLARPYTKLPSGERQDIYEQRLFIGTPAGDAFSTTADLDRFAQALLANKLLSPGFTQIALGGKLPLPPMPGPGPGPQAAFQCYGPIGALVSNQRTIGHAGGSQGVSTTIDMYPDSEWVVVVLSNYEDAVRPIAGLARKLITQ